MGVFIDLLRRPGGTFALVTVTLLCIVAIGAPLIAPYGPNAIAPAKRLMDPSLQHWLGTDHLGRDILSRLVSGARVALGVSLSVIALSLTAGLMLGIVAALSPRAIDLVIVGIGVAANDALVQAAGLRTGNGILVDAFGRTDDPAIYAMGDCALVPFEDMAVRLESVQNAVDQAEAVAAHLAGGTEPYRPKPWFWSDQYDVKLQIAGFGLGHDETLTRPGAREGAVSVWYFRSGRLIAVDALNEAKAYVTGKKLIEMGVTPDRNKLADPAADLRSLLPG